MMHLEILQVPDCPNMPLLEQRIGQALAGQPIQWELRHVIVEDPRSAELAGMTGSPTLLVDGRDPFAETDQVPSVSCRLYRDATGAVGGAPTVTALRTAFGMDSPATDVRVDSESINPAARCCPADSDPAADLEASRGRATPTGPAETAVHHAILGGFAERGTSPTIEYLEPIARQFDSSATAILRSLHDADVIRTNTSGQIQSAYPFSASPTPHRVHLPSGVEVYAMCAIDALGISSMLGADTTITTSDAGDQAPITISVRGIHAHAQPATAVVYVGSEAAQGPSADICCSHINFFKDRASGEAWATARPNVSGTVLDLDAATNVGAAVFGTLLGT
ncbi:alkylmercury lyase family protein [Rhodococcus globerulus]|uniref:alkylmercury lyase family protein n=1 Tax=Rhodococcus globerulus TaxID=33008 RepID=UPI00301700E5